MADSSKDVAALIVALKKDDRDNPHGLASKGSKVSDLLKPKDDDDAEDKDLSKPALEAAAKAFWEAGSKGDWSKAAAALSDVHELQCDSCSPKSFDNDQDLGIYDAPDDE